ncbi:MAG: 3-deoxy-D-manno-octulosonic acid transferase, partial [Pedobacter sp.]
MLELLLYNAFLKSYELAINLAAKRNKKAKQWIDGRKNIFGEIESKVSKIESNNKRIWFHVASLGEFEQGRPLIEKIKAENPEIIIILTFFSPSGYE